jgi:hypothetical protein
MKDDSTFKVLSPTEVLVYPDGILQGQDVNVQIRGHFSSTDKVMVSIFDITGKRVLGSIQKDSANFELPTSTLNKGLYILKFDTQGKTTAKRLIVR